jgi:hypothetical protein
MDVMEAMLVTPIGIGSCAVMLSLALVTLVKWQRRRTLMEARLNRGLKQYVSVWQATAEQVDGTMVPSAATVLQ